MVEKKEIRKLRSQLFKNILIRTCIERGITKEQFEREELKFEKENKNK